MRKFKFGKLVRDKIVEGIKEAGNTPVFHQLDNDAFIEELKKKVVEEAVEIPNEFEKEELLKEIADLQEVIDALIDALSSSKKEILEIQKKKNDKAGSFNKRLFIDHVEAQDDSEWVKHYEKSPEKYPEIKD